MSVASNQPTQRSKRPDRLRERLRALPEMAIEGLIRLCGYSAIFFVFGIFFFVLREGAPMLFGGLNLAEFFTSTDWNPVSKTPHYGILALISGTASVTLLSMAIAVPCKRLRFRPTGNRLPPPARTSAS